MMSHQDNNFDHHRSVDSKAQDPTSMTIEFLRARLLAERAVSKSARAKLDGLSDKVAELEEQLKIVTLQRKKAEQATADILAILEENGYTDVSDAYDDDDSNSDQESYSQTNSGSGKSITWRGRRREPGSSDKFKESRNRRHRGFESAYLSSPRHRQGRSCRQIRRNESRIVSEECKIDVNPVDTKTLPQRNEEASRTVVDVDVVKRDESLEKTSDSNGLEKENSMDINLERALENRAKVIGSFEDMEETQREWEKKFSENKSSAVDSCDLGNHSDVTDESNGEKPQTQFQDSTVRDTRSIAKEADLREPFETSSHGSPDNSVTSLDNRCRSCGSKSTEQDVSPCVDEGKNISESPKRESSHQQSYKDTHEHSLSPSVPQPNTRGGAFSSNVATIQKIEYPLVPVVKEKPDSCDTVLTALKQAKLSLQEKVNSRNIKRPDHLSESSHTSTPGSYMNTLALPVEPAFGTTSTRPGSGVGPMVDFTVGCAGLFRVPTDFSPDVSRRNNYLASSSQKALVSHIPERDIPLLNAGFQSQSLDTRPPVSTADRLLTTPYIGGPKLWTGFGVDSDAQESILYKGTPSVPSRAISSGTLGFGGNQTFSTSFNLDRQVSTYTPMTSTGSSFPDSGLRSREMYSTPYYTRPVGMPPTGGSDDGLSRRV